MNFSEANPAIALAICKETRQVIDCERVAYSFYIDALLDRHDLSKVDIVIRQPTRTVTSSEPDFKVEEAPPTTPQLEDEDIPF